MTTANIKATISCDVHKVMEAILAVERYPAWRSGVSKIAVAGEKQYIEYTEDGYAARLKFTAVESDSRLELELENDHVKEHWTCVFIPGENESEVSISSSVSAKGLSARPVGQSVFEQSYIKKEQEQFVLDLKKYLS